MDCKTKYCRNQTKGKRILCAKCASRKWREENPVKASYANLKNNAKRRGKAFEITLEWYKEFAVRTKYIYGKGRTRESLHIDRIDETKGYTEDNLQALENHKNVTKYLRWREDSRGKPTDFSFTKLNNVEQGDCPF